MNEKLEQVARIIAAETWRAYCEGHSGMGGEELPEPNEVFLEDARITACAAIEAMREPTAGMIDAGRDVGPDAPYGVDETLKRWQAMCDEATEGGER